MSTSGYLRTTKREIAAKEVRVKKGTFLHDHHAPYHLNCNPA